MNAKKVNRSLRVIGVSDLHGSIERLELLLELTSADLYVLSGDLLYNPFYNFEDLEAFYVVQDQVRNWRGTASNVSVPLFLRQQMASFDDERKAVAQQYLELADKAERTMQRKYRAIERLAGLIPRSRLLCIPGNYDLDLRSTALNAMQLHKHAVDLEGYRIGGYGGAPVFTSGIPEHLAVRFHESRYSGENEFSEARDTLFGLDPDIAVVHTPPLGIQDSAHGRQFGSWGIREFVENSQRVKLLFCGHVHSGWGVRKVGNCVVVNSGNFGQVVEGSGYRHGGYFSEVILENDTVVSAMLKRLERRKIWHLAEYTAKDGVLREQVIDERRTAARRYHAVDVQGDDQIDKEVDLQLLEHYNQIKLFLRRFETAASEQRVDDLRDMVRRTRERGTEIAFDVLGSVNMGQSTDASDVDAILYIEDDPANLRYDPTYWPTMVEEVTEGRYAMDFTDIIDLWEVRDAILARDATNEALQRFVIYRTIGRPVNVRLLRKYDDLLIDAGQLKSEIQMSLRKDLEMMAGTYSQKESLQKYTARLNEAGIRIPSRIQARIFKYLHTLT